MVIWLFLNRTIATLLKRTLWIVLFFFGGLTPLLSVNIIAEEKDSIFAEPTDSINQYIEDLTDLLSLKLFTLTKYNTLDILYPEGKVMLRPNGNTNLGFGFNYKFLGLSLSYGIPLSQSSVDKYGKTSRFDVQVSYFGKRIGFDGFLQGYSGYYMANPNDFMDWEKSYYPQIPDLSVFSLGGNFFYMFNSKEYSYKAAYIRNTVQKQSAGSLSAGLFFYHDQVKSGSGFIPQEIPDSLWSEFDLKEFDATSIGISVGYQYTFVIGQNFFINLQLTPGIGYRRMSGKALDGSPGIDNSAAWQIYGRAAIGYEFRHFYLGATASTILRSFTYNDYEVDLGTEQFRIMIGRRFDVSRKNQK
jgi:hypothetical protein